MFHFSSAKAIASLQHWGWWFGDVKGIPHFGDEAICHAQGFMKNLLWDSSMHYLIGWPLRAGERSGCWRTLGAGKPGNILFTAKAPRFTGFETVVRQAIFAVFPRHISYAGGINYIHYTDYNQIISLISFIGARLYICIGMHKHGYVRSFCSMYLASYNLPPKLIIALNMKVPFAWLEIVCRWDWEEGSCTPAPLCRVGVFTLYLFPSLPGQAPNKE